MPPKLFSFTHFRKNASVTPLVSHTFKTKDLKPFRFIHFQKKGGGYPFLLFPTVLMRSKIPTSGFRQTSILFHPPGPPAVAGPRGTMVHSPGVETLLRGYSSKDF